MKKQIERIVVMQKPFEKNMVDVFYTDGDVETLFKNNFSTFLFVLAHHKKAECIKISMKGVETNVKCNRCCHK